MFANILTMAYACMDYLQNYTTLEYVCVCVCVCLCVFYIGPGSSISEILYSRFDGVNT